MADPTDFGAVGPKLITRLVQENCAVLHPENLRRNPEFDSDLDRPL